ncbi:MAG: hypothetical protein KA758_01350 [Acidimicrobiales bacterium]|nr:hypothetical protein [Acidimicrobiales bacterium]
MTDIDDDEPTREVKFTGIDWEDDAFASLPCPCEVCNYRIEWYYSTCDGITTATTYEDVTDQDVAELIAIVLQASPSTAVVA